MTGSVIDKTVICREAEHIKELFRGEINEAENELIAYVEEEKNRPVETQEKSHYCRDEIEDGVRGLLMRFGVRIPMERIL